MEEGNRGGYSGLIRGARSRRAVGIRTVASGERFTGGEIARANVATGRGYYTNDDNQDGDAGGVIPLFENLEIVDGRSRVTGGRRGNAVGIISDDATQIVACGSDIVASDSEIVGGRRVSHANANLGGYIGRRGAAGNGKIVGGSSLYANGSLGDNASRRNARLVGRLKGYSNPIGDLGGCARGTGVSGGGRVAGLGEIVPGGEINDINNKIVVSGRLDRYAGGTGAASNGKIVGESSLSANSSLGEDASGRTARLGGYSNPIGDLGGYARRTGAGGCGQVVGHGEIVHDCGTNDISNKIVGTGRLGKYASRMGAAGNGEIIGGSSLSANGSLGRDVSGRTAKLGGYSNPIGDLGGYARRTGAGGGGQVVGHGEIVHGTNDISNKIVGSGRFGRYVNDGLNENLGGGNSITDGRKGSDDGGRGVAGVHGGYANDSLGGYRGRRVADSNGHIAAGKLGEFGGVTRNGRRVVGSVIVDSFGGHNTGFGRGIGINRHAITTGGGAPGGRYPGGRASTYDSGVDNNTSVHGGYSRHDNDGDCNSAISEHYSDDPNDGGSDGYGSVGGRCDYGRTSNVGGGWYDNCVYYSGGIHEVGCDDAGGGGQEGGYNGCRYDFSEDGEYSVVGHGRGHGGSSGNPSCGRYFQKNDGRGRGRHGGGRGRYIDGQRGGNNGGRYDSDIHVYNAGHHGRGYNAGHWHHDDGYNGRHRGGHNGIWYDSANGRGGYNGDGGHGGGSVREHGEGESSQSQSSGSQLPQPSKEKKKKKVGGVYKGLKVLAEFAGGVAGEVVSEIISDAIED